MNDALDEALLPCPFCGGKKMVVRATDYLERRTYAVSCRYLDCHGGIWTLGHGYFMTREEAIAAWNTRPAMKQDDRRIAAPGSENADYTRGWNDAIDFMEKDR